MKRSFPRMTPARTAMALAALVGAAAASGPDPAGAAAAPAICAGVSESGQNPPEAADYSLKLVYAQPDGAYLGDISTRIADGDTVLVDTHCDGPWLLADLPGGSYQVTATYRGRTQSLTVSVDEQGQTEQVIRFE